MYYDKYKRGSDPITSYGLIVKSVMDSKDVYLLHQRRDNFEYMDFMRGNWRDRKQATFLISMMSHEERYRIQNYTFGELWDDLWVDHNCRIYKDDTKAKRKYDTIKPFIQKILDSCDKDNKLPWGFPKGKKNRGETNLECAIRECKEETNIPFSDIEILPFHSISETFRGSNGKMYKTEYFVGYIPEPLNSGIIETPQCIRKTTVSDESRDAGWFTLSQAKTYLDESKCNILDQIDFQQNINFQS